MVTHADVGVIALPYAEAETAEILGAKFFDNIFDPIVASSAGGESGFYFSKRNINVIMEDDKISRGAFVKIKQGLDALPGCIHEGLWFDPENFSPLDDGFTDCSLKLFF